MKIPDIAEYEDTDSELAKYTITNLHHEIEKLKKENKELDKICARKSHYIDKKDLEITQKDLEIERLTNIIGKAIEYIKINSLYDVSYGEDVLMVVSNTKELLDILKVEDK